MLFRQSPISPKKVPSSPEVLDHKVNFPIFNVVVNTRSEPLVYRNVDDLREPTSLVSG